MSSQTYHPNAARRFTLVLLLGLLLPLALFVFLGSSAVQAQSNPPADIVFIIDESGSMGPYQTAVENNVNFIASQLGVFLDPAYALVGFGSSGDNIRTLTNFTDETGLSSALSQLVTSGGFEPGVEATSYAMTQLTGYRPGAGVCVVLITDEDSDGGDLATANSDLDARGAFWYGVVDPNFGNTPDTYGPNPGSMSEHTGGAVFSIFDFINDPQDVLDALLLDCAGNILEDITLFPPFECNPPGTTHVVTATVRDSSLNPLPGIDVEFEIIAGPNSGITGTGTTDANGQTPFSYMDANAVSGDVDTIQACFVDSDGNTLCAEAQKCWETPNAVTIDDFNAVAHADGTVLLSWVTSGEINHMGFNVYRSTSETFDAATATQLNAELLAAQGSASGSAYSFSDAPAAGLYTYFLESVDTSGAAVIEAQIDVTTQVPTSAALTGLAGAGGAMWLPLLLIGTVAVVLIALYGLARRRVV